MTPFIGQIALFPITYAPKGWADCDGRLISITQNTALYSLLGTAYGGNGQTNFALPDLRGRAPVCFGVLPGGGNYVIGQRAGLEGVALTADTIPIHLHRMAGTDNPGTVNDPSNKLLAMAGGGLLAEGASGLIYDQYQPGSDQWLSDNCTPGGGGKAHNNMQPSLVLRYCICVDGGIFPQRPTPSPQ